MESNNANPWLLSELLSHQTEAVKVLSANRRHLLGDSTGLGKTYSVLASYAALVERYPDKKWHLLVVTTKTAMSSWRKELTKRTNFKYLTLTVGEKHNAEIFAERAVKHQVTVISASCIPHFNAYLSALYQNFHVVLALDEAHQYKNSESNAGKIVRYLGSKSTVFWALTATPILNKIEDLHGVIDMLIPGYLGTYYEFLANYTVRKKRRGQGRVFYEIVGYQRLPELRELLKSVMLSRSASYPLQFHYHQSKLTETEEYNYIQAAKGLMGDEYKDFVNRLPDLQLVVDNAIDVTDLINNPDTRRPNESVDLSSKETQLIELMGSILASGSALILFTEFLLTQQRLAMLLDQHLPKVTYYYLNGSTEESERDKITKLFKPGQIVLTTQAGGQSINLQAANHIIFYDVPFSMGILIQAIGRIARVDSVYDSMHVHLLEAVDTIDTYKTKLVHHNSTLIEGVVGGNANLPPGMDKVTKRAIVRLRKDLLWRASH
jgi:SNF2 family DNA or RNA helicase